jgi:hypothetical protein
MVILYLAIDKRQCFWYNSGIIKPLIVSIEETEVEFNGYVERTLIKKI